ncbi:VOC family protein [Pseudonocardia phyllosphaerae]|uniref:VOC family protein n=1 Tax=Pseudonocardia phyllosphaerae TaxID=3390502 RepID=UPI00397997F7
MAPLISFRGLVLDVIDPVTAAPFWAGTLGLEIGAVDARGAVLHGATPQHTLRLLGGAAPKTVKNRTHLDVRAPSLEPFAGLHRVTEPGALPWTVLQSPEGDEFCVFVSPDVTSPQLKDLEVDAVDHHRIATWWAGVFGAEAYADDDGTQVYTYVHGVPGAPFEDIDVAPVPEPRSAPNRLRWDVSPVGGAGADDLVARGATVLGRTPDGTLLADPEGNGFRLLDG